jgi:glycosyltransferase involved in cell wall biosynthesis
MVNILHLGKFYPPSVGGIENVTEGLAVAAIARFCNVTVVCFGDGERLVKEVLDGVEVIRAPVMGTIKSQPLSLIYIFSIAKNIGSADIVHLHVPNMLAVVCTLLVPKKSKLLVHWHSDVIGKGLLGLLFKPFEDFMLRRADRVVSTSLNYRDASYQLSRYNAKVRVVPLGICDPLENGELDYGSLPLDIEEKIRGRKVVLSVGRLVEYKGFDILIEAARYMRDDAVIFIVGSGSLHASLDSQIKLHSLEHKVFLLGRLENAELRKLFRKACLFCLGSNERSEAFGVVLVEAMAFGLPVIATKIPGSGVSWVNEEGVSGYNVPINDPTALAASCNRILDSELERDLLSKGARQRFLECFTSAVTDELFMSIYEELVSFSK